MAELNGAPAGPDELRALALTNYGHFTTMRVDDGHVRGLGLHLERLVRDCREVFGAELDIDRVRELARRVVEGKSGASVVRVTIFDPALDIGHPSTATEPHVLVTVRASGPGPLPPLRVRSVPYVRDMPSVKHVGLFGSLRHRREAQLAGYDDALFTSAGGGISEGPTWNVGFYDGEDVVWPKATVLPGVTMALLQQAYVRTLTASVGAADLRGLQAAFATNAAIGVRPISAVDQTRLDADHPILDTLRQLYLSDPGEPL